MVDLRAVTEGNQDAIMALAVAKDQPFVAPNQISLANAYVFWLDTGRPPITFAIYHGDELVGFTMAAFFPTIDNPIYEVPMYYIWRFMIDQNHQHKGHGSQALALLLDCLRTKPQGPADWVYLSYVPGADHARHLYAKAGFQETGDIDEGEVVMRLAL